MGLISPIKTFVDKAILTAADLNTEYLNLYDNIVAGTTVTVGSVQLEDSHASTSTTTAACPKNVKEAYDLAATHKDNHDPEDGSDALDTAAPAELASVQAAGVGSSHSFARADHAHQIQHSVANDHLITIDSASVAANDYAQFTASGLKGRNYAEMRTDLNIEDGADVTDATNVEAAGAVIENDYNANTFLYAVTDNTPIVKTRAEVVALLSGQAAADFAMNTHKITGVVDPTANQEAATKKYVDDNAGGGGGLSWAVISTNTNAVDAHGYLIDATLGNITLTLPVSPSAGDTVGVCDIYNQGTVNVITINRNTNNIEGTAENLIIDLDGAGFTIVYTDATRGWEIVTELSGIGGTGSMPVVDTIGIVKGSADATKILRFEVDGFTTSTTRVLTPQNKDYTIADNADLHTQGTDTDLDATFEATFVKKADTVNVLSDIISTGANIEDAVTKKHTVNTDTALGTQTADINMGTHKLTALSVPAANGQSIRSTTKITEVNLEAAHDHVSASNPHSGSAASGSNSDITVLSGLTTDLSIAQGGTGQSTAQTAINALSAVSGATNEHVLTKDTATGNAIFKTSGGGGAPDAHKDSHDPADGSDPLDTAVAAEVSVVVAAGAGVSHSFARADHIHAIVHAITNNHLVTIDGTTNQPASGDYSKFTASGLEGMSKTQMLSDLNVEDGADVTDVTNVAAAGAVMDTDFAAADEVMVGTGAGTHGQITLAASQLLGKAAAGAVTNLTAAGVRTIINVLDGADVTTTVKVNAAGAVMESDYNANTFLYAVTDDTPVVKTRAEVVALLSGQAAADFAMNTHKITGVTDPTAAQDAATKAYADTMLTKAAPELEGQLQVHEHDIKLDSLLSVDGKYSGITCDGVLGATLAFGDLVYLNTTDQRWELADADAEATGGDVMLAIVLAAGIDGNTRLLLLQGFIREDDWNFTSYGQTLFMSCTAGDMTATAPSTTGDIVRVVGYASTFADQIYFNPSGTWIEIT